jgi:hypothetical protein
MCRMSEQGRTFIFNAELKKQTQVGINDVINENKCFYRLSKCILRN